MSWKFLVAGRERQEGGGRFRRVSCFSLLVSSGLGCLLALSLSLLLYSRSPSLFLFFVLGVQVQQGSRARWFGRVWLKPSSLMAKALLPLPSLSPASFTLAPSSIPFSFCDGSLFALPPLFSLLLFSFLSRSLLLTPMVLVLVSPPLLV